MLAASGLFGLTVLLFVPRLFPEAPDPAGPGARHAFLGVALVWLAGIVAVPVVVCRSVVAGRAVGRMVLVMAMVVLAVLLGALPAGFFRAALACLCVASCMMALWGMCLLGIALWPDRLAVATGVILLACLAYGSIFWLNPLIVGLPPGGRTALINAVLHVHPLAALCDVFGVADIRALEQMAFSYHYSRLSTVPFAYPDWFTWVGVNVGLAAACLAGRWTVMRRR